MPKRRSAAASSKTTASKRKKLASEDAPENEATSSAASETPPKLSKAGSSSAKKSNPADSAHYLPMSSADKLYGSPAETSVGDGKKWTLKITSWNVNGVRAWLKKDVLKYIDRESPDMLMLQEIKCAANDIPKEVKTVKGYNCYWYSAEAKEGSDKSGYSGTALWSKTKPLSVQYGMGIEEHDSEGRLITAEYEKFYLVGAYVPNSGRGLVRLAYRQKWNADFLKYMNDLDKKKPVIYTGDLNVAHLEIDLSNPKSNTKNAGFTKEERDDFSALLASGIGFMDSFRVLYPERTGAYTFWTFMGNARAKNVGWRLDYFVLSNRLKPSLADVLVRADVLGSDHCPLTLLLNQT